MINTQQEQCCNSFLCESCPLSGPTQCCELCPYCRISIHGKYFKNNRIKGGGGKEKKTSTEVPCIYRGSGCGWVGNEDKMDDHIHTSCEYKIIECPDCTEMLQKCNLKKHMKDECAMRPHKCPHCKEEGPYHFITNKHQHKCPDIEFKCTNDGCGQLVKHFDAETHIEVCPKQEVICPFHNMGCNFTSKREDLLSHIEKEMALHIDLVAQTVEAIHSIPVVKLMSYSRLHCKPMFSKDFYTGHGGYRMRLILANININDNNDSKGDGSSSTIIDDKDGRSNEDGQSNEDGRSSKDGRSNEEGADSSSDLDGDTPNQRCSSDTNQDEASSEYHSNDDRDSTTVGQHTVSSTVEESLIICHTPLHIGEEAGHESSSIHQCEEEDDTPHTSKDGPEESSTPADTTESDSECYLSVYLNLMPGDNDDTLPFPLSGEFTVALLNQLEDDKHYEEVLTVTAHDDVFHRVFDENDYGIGTHTFIHLRDLEYDSNDNTQYLVNGNLFFRVTFVSFSQMKPWLAIK